MLRKILANALARKLVVFTGVLAVTFAALGGSLRANFYSDEQLGHLVQSELSTIRRALEPAENEQENEQSPLSTEWLPYGIASTDFDAVEAEEAFKAETLEVPAASDPIQSMEDFIYSDAIPLSRELQEYTFKECLDKGLDYKTVLALMWRESKFEPDVVNTNRNGTQDSGIMQINDVNREWLSEELGITDLMCPMQNITAGTTLLSRLVKKYGEHYALMAYQFGEQGMLNQVKQGVTTTVHVRDIYEKRAQFVEILTA